MPHTPPLNSEPTPHTPTPQHNQPAWETSNDPQPAPPPARTDHHATNKHPPRTTNAIEHSPPRVHDDQPPPTPPPCAIPSPPAPKKPHHPQLGHPPLHSSCRHAPLTTCAIKHRANLLSNQQTRPDPSPRPPPHRPRPTPPLLPPTHQLCHCPTYPLAARPLPP